MREPNQAVKDLLREMGWIHFTERLPPDNYTKEILELDMYGHATVVWCADWHYRFRTARNRGNKCAWAYWMPVPFPPLRVIEKLMEEG